jgi:hypothetical protein
MDELRQQLERWQAKRLIDAEQVAAILADAAGRPGGSGAAAGTADPQPRQRRLGEALGYVGAVCVVSAGLLVVGREWARLGPGARSTLLLIAVIVLAAGGWWATQQPPAPVRRLGGVLWFLTVATVAGLTGVVADQVLHQSHGVVGLTSALAATAAGALCWHLRASTLQQVAMFASLLATVIAAVDLIAPAPTSPGWGGGAVWAVGLVWLLVGLRRLLTPARTAEVLGALAVLVGAETVRTGQLRSVGLALGLLSAAALVGTGAATRRAVLLGVGAVGLFVFLFDAVLTWFGRGATVPLALLAAGGALLLVAILTGRTRSWHAVRDRSGSSH